MSHLLHIDRTSGLCVSTQRDRDQRFFDERHVAKMVEHVRPREWTGRLLPAAVLGQG